MIGPLWLLIGFQSATDHIVTVTDGITKVTDHFVMEMLKENRVGGGPSIYSPCKMSVYVCMFVCVWFRFFWFMDKQRKLHAGAEGEVNELSE